MKKNPQSNNNKANNQTNKPRKTHTFLTLHKFRKQDTCLEFAASVSKCKRQNYKELLIICVLLMESGRNWQLICLSIAKLCAMIDDYYCHFLPSNSAKLHIIQNSSEWHSIIFAKPLMSLFWTHHKTQDTSKTAEGHASYRSCNPYQMYACLSKIRCKKSWTRVPEVPATGFKIFTHACWRRFWTVLIFTGTSWAQGCSGYSPFQFSKDQYCPSETLKCCLEPQIPLLQSCWPMSAWRSPSHIHMLKISCLPSDQTCLNHRKHCLPPPINWKSQREQLQY